MLYRTLAEPYFRYCSTAWGKCGQTLPDKLQMLQNRAAGIVRGVKFEEADHNQLLRSPEWLSIRQLIDYDTAFFMYKVANGIVPEQTQFLFDKCTNIHSHNTRSASSGNYVIPKMKTVKCQTAFVFWGNQGWSKLPTHTHIPRKIRRIPHSTKHMMAIKIKRFFLFRASFTLSRFVLFIFIFCYLLLLVILVI